MQQMEMPYNWLFYKVNFVCLELSVCDFAWQDMLWCGIDCRFFQLGLGQVHFAKEVKTLSEVFRTEPEQVFLYIKSKTPQKS